jgi:sigma-B regulation protein RsbU (phosphoserine phosphatase)
MTEIKIATQLQHQLLPMGNEPPLIGNYDLFVASQSALEIAGDYAEVRQNSSGEYLGCVIDVMGKGVSAAILAGIFRSQFLGFSERGGKLVTFLESANRALETQLGDATMFITAFVFKLNNSSQDLSYVVAGHPPALFLRQDGSTEFLKSEGPPLGLFKEAEFVESQIQFMPGDRMLVVTDGLYEFSTSETEIYGWDRMVEWIEMHRDESPHIIWDKLQNLIIESRSQQRIQQEDDETILILTRKAK